MLPALIGLALFVVVIGAASIDEVLVRRRNSIYLACAERTQRLRAARSCQCESAWAAEIDGQERCLTCLGSL